MYFRKSIIYFTLLLYLLVFLSTEVFSLLNILNVFSVRIFWLIILFFSILFLRKKIFFENINFKVLRNVFLSKENYIIIFILLITFINSIIYSPNTLDAMTYHMTKIMHWIQNGNVNFYPTNDLRELILAPLSEYMVLNLYLITGGDYLSNLVQWYSMFVCCVTVSLISKELKLDLKYQVFSSLFVVTLPMGILQSSSTQTDYVTSMWLTMMVFFILNYINKNDFKYILYFSTALALGIFTKGTFYFFAFPFCVWLGLILLFKSKDKFLKITIIPLIILVINSGHYYRNINLYGNPLGLSEEAHKWNNEVLSLKSFSSNTIKNIGLNLSLPNKEVNRYTSRLINNIHEFIGISAGDPRTSTGGRGFYIPFSFYESTAPNTFHFILILISILIFDYRKKENKIFRNYIFSVISGFLLVSFLLKWMPQGNRILLCSFVLVSPFVAHIISKIKLKRLINVISILLFMYALPYLMFNKSRPLVSKLSFNENGISFNKPDFITSKRAEHYYIADKYYNGRNLYNSHIDFINQIKKSDCRYIGLNDYPKKNLDYPFWNLLKKNMDNDKFKIYNINVQNKSKIYSKDNEVDKICSVIYVDKIEFIN